MMIVVTRIPTHRNNGRKVTRAEMRSIINRILDTFHGYSMEGPMQGGWVAKDGKRYVENSFRMEIVVGDDRVDEARELFMSIGRQLGQRAVYFEVREGGEIIDLE
jgi:hypothetical protein